LFFIVKRQNVANSTCLKFFQCLSRSSVKTDTVNTESIKTDQNKIETVNTDIESFGYRCADSNDVVTFIEFIIGRKTKINIHLYILSNFEALNETPTYDLLEEYIEKNNKIASYNNTYVKRDRLVNYCNMLKNMYNIF